MPGAFLSLCQTVHYVFANVHGTSCKGLERTDKQYPSFHHIYIFPTKEADSNLCAKRTTVKKNPQYHASRDKNCSQRHPRHDKTVRIALFQRLLQSDKWCRIIFAVRFNEGHTYSAVHHCPQDSVSPKITHCHLSLTAANVSCRFSQIFTTQVSNHKSPREDCCSALEMEICST